MAGFIPGECNKITRTVFAVFLILTMTVVTWEKTSADDRFASDSSIKNKTVHSVLILNSYHLGYRWSDDIRKAIQEHFEKSTIEVKLYYEFLDTRLFPDKTHFDELRKLIGKKYKKNAIDLMIVSDNEAFEFVLDERETYFSGIPILFCGVNYFDPAMIQGKKLITGLAEYPDLRKNIDLAFDLIPDLNHLVFMTNPAAKTGQMILSELADLTPELEKKISVTIWNSDSIKKDLNMVRKLSKGSAVFCIGSSRSLTGDFLEYPTQAKLLSEVCSVPIFSVWEFYLGNGFLGGLMINAVDQGQHIAIMAEKVLTGDPIDRISVEIKGPASYMFDDRQLTFFGIDRSHLPENSLLVNRTPSIYETHKNFVLKVGTIILLLSVLALVLAVNISKRFQAEALLKKHGGLLEKKIDERTMELEQTNQALTEKVREQKKSRHFIEVALKEKEILLREIHHRVKNNMQIISSLLNLQINRLDDTQIISQFLAAENRIHSMSLVHEILYQTESLAEIDFQLYLEQLTKHILTMFRKDKQVHIEIEAAHIQLPMEQAIVCGLVVTELVSNSFKYAFPQIAKGRIRIQVRQDQAGEFEMIISDNGRGLASGYDWQTADTLGLRLVRELVRGQLEGKLDLTDSQGLTWQIQWADNSESSTDL